MKKILNCFFDWLAISIGITALTLLLAQPESKCLDGLTITGALFCAVYIIRALCLLIRRPQFDWHLFHGSFLRKVICLVLLIPCLLASVIKCKYLLHDASITYSEELVFEDDLYKSDKKDLKYKQTDPPLLWCVYYHFIDPGNQHMTTSETGRGWSAFIAILGVILLNGLLVTSIIGWIDSRKDKWLKGEIRYGRFAFVCKKIVVVIGANESAPTIIKNLLGGYGEKQIDYVILLTNENVEKIRAGISSYFSEEEEKRVIIYNGQLDSIEEINKLHIRKATEIYVLGENSNDDISQSYHDTQNMRCVHNIASYLTGKCIERKIVCRVSFEYQTTYSVFQFSDLPDNIRQHLVFIPFNTYENWAQRVFVKGEYTETVKKKVLPAIRRMDLQPVWINKILYPIVNSLQSTMPKNNDEPRTIKYIPLDGTGISKNSKENVHLVVVGMSKMGIAMAIQAAQVAHYPNFSSGEKNDKNEVLREPSLIRTKITFIDENADNEMNFFMGRYQNLFALSRHRFIDATCIECNLNPEWIDPMSQSDSEYKQLGDNFLDIEWEFVKGGIESPGVMKFLKEVAIVANNNNENHSLLTIAICQPLAHEAIASALYMPNEIYDYAQQILVYQREASDIVYNLSRKEEAFIFKRYSKLRPFGMQYADFTMDKNNYYRSQLCNYVYTLIFDTKIDNSLIPSKISNLKISDRNGEMMKIARESWKKLSIFNKWSNRYLANSFETKLRSVGAYFDDVSLHYEKICALFEDNKSYMSECEHNRWNIQQLLMGFRAYKDNEIKEFKTLRDKAGSNKVAQEAFKGYKDKMKNSPEKVHLNICSASQLHHLDKKAEGYDEIFNSAIPAILLCIENHYKNSSRS